MFGRVVNWRRVWLVVLVCSVVLYFGSCSVDGYLHQYRPELFVEGGYYAFEEDTR